MTATLATAKATLTPTAIVMFTIAAVGTLLVVPHVIIASIDAWPPQLMTLHAVATGCSWLAGVAFRSPPRPSAAQAEIDDLERRLRATDG